MPYTPEQVDKYLSYVKKSTGDKYTPEQFDAYAAHIRENAAAKEKPKEANTDIPYMRGLLPEGVGKLFPTEKESQEMRAAQGVPAVPPEPVPEYSPEEEMMLSSIVAPGAIPQGIGLMQDAAPVVRQGARMLKNPYVKKAAGLLGLGAIGKHLHLIP